VVIENVENVDQSVLRIPEVFAELSRPIRWRQLESAKSLFLRGSNPYLHSLETLGWVDGRLDFSIFLYRERFIADFSYAIPGAEALEALVGYGPIVEIGSGNGYWGWCLKQLGCSVRMYDNYSWGLGWTTWWKRPRRGGPSVLRRYGKWTLFLCWPWSGGKMATECLRYYGGSRVAYIGERGGLCAEGEFFDRLGLEGFKLVRVIELPHWFGMHDNLFVYER